MMFLGAREQRLGGGKREFGLSVCGTKVTQRETTFGQHVDLRQVNLD